MVAYSVHRAIPSILVKGCTIVRALLPGGVTLQNLFNTKKTTFDITANVLRILIAILAPACFVIGAGTSKLNAVHKASLPGIDQTVNYILDLVNTQSGATKSSRAGKTTWAYSMALAAPCTLLLTEELQQINSDVAGSATKPIYEINNYLIPAADLALGKLGTRLILDRQS